VSNYVKNTDYAVKDGLLTGNPNKIIKGTEIDDEFNDIAVAIQTKADLVSPTFTGTPLAPTAVAGTSTTQIATTAFAAAASTAAVTAERTATATLTNKTLTSPTINGGTITGITDLVVADGGTGVSSLTADNVILGDGTNPVKFVAPSTNGNVLTSNGTTWTSAAIPAQGIGVGQTWQDLTSSRSGGTTYTNSTGRPIMVAVNATSSVNTITTLSLSIDGNTVAQNGSQGGNNNGVVAIVPNGSTYSISLGTLGGLSTWWELR
jgi:hypothetical protein